MTLRSVRDLEVICPHLKLLGTMVFELHDMRIVCLLQLRVVTPSWVTNTVSFLLVINYIHHSGSFEVLQAKVKCRF